MDQSIEELSKKLEELKDNPDQGIIEIARALAEQEKIPEFNDLLDQFSGAAQDIGMNPNETRSFTFGIARAVISAAVWKGLCRFNDREVALVKQGWLDLASKANASEFMHAFMDTIACMLLASQMRGDKPEDK